MAEGAAYRLDPLGWLQFERLCALVLEAEAGLTDLAWHGHADDGRVALVDRSLVLAAGGARLPGPVAVVVVWVRNVTARADLLQLLAAGIQAVPRRLGSWCDSLLVLTNADVEQLSGRVRRRLPDIKRCRVLGASELSSSLDRHAAVRIALPSVLGVRDLTELIELGARKCSTLDVDAATELAKVFWPTEAYSRARTVLGAHRFVVLTGPPEMGKTAIAQMLALALLTDGWEAFDCTHPEQLWQAFDRGRRQVFVCDDAFGSTEYRPDCADRWARELGRILTVLDDRHWLIWTSRPAPLKAGLRRVHRERGSERFPSPGEVLVDAAALDLAEKTLILFRHVKHRGAEPGQRRAVRTAAVSIVEHPHFTPERIRRLVAERLTDLAAVQAAGPPALRELVEAELARPTAAMARSFEALDSEHRELLIALLDVPAGLIDERELAAAARRHRSGGLSATPTELIDRLTDHFLRVTPLGIGWVHPSWRDLVIDGLRADASARQRFLAACGVHGALLALSHSGGAMGARALPLLVTDADFDAFADGVARMLRDLDDHALGHLLAAMADASDAPLSARQLVEIQSIATYLLRAVARQLGQREGPLPVFVLEAWFTLRARVAERVAPPALMRTWAALHSCSSLRVPVTGPGLARFDEWLAFVQLLARHEPAVLSELGFGDDDLELLGHTAITLSRVLDPDLRLLCQTVLERIAQIAPDYAGVAAATARKLDDQPGDSRWWVPEDISAPPSTEPVAQGWRGFTRGDIRRVLTDL